MDFLSNGFQQLYSELENEFSFWDYPSVENSAEIMSNIVDYDEYHIETDNKDSTEITTLLTSDYGKTFEPYPTDFDNYFGMNNDLSESDWEHTFLDNYLEIPRLTELLPERTALCNDSCTIFLKESSDNLKKFRPKKQHEKKSSNDHQVPDSDKVFPCTYGSCKKIYAKPAHLKAHIRRHLGDKPYICTWPNCTWKFSRSDELARHRRSHSGVKPYKCTYCTKCFSRSDHLAKHRKVHERKLAANKLKGIILTNLQQVRPGRKPRIMCES